MPSKKPLKTSHIVLIVAAGAIGLIFWIAIIASIASYKPSTSTSPPKVQEKPQDTPKAEEPKKDTSEFKADIKHSGTALMVTNEEDIDWTGCKIRINSNYIYDNATVPKRDSLIIPFAGFAKSDGTRFDYTETSLRNVSIGSCEGENSLRDGYYVFE